VCLREGDELVTVSGEERPMRSPVRLPIAESLAGDVFASGEPRRVSAAEEGALLRRLTPSSNAALLVPITFRGETLGVLAAIDREDGREFGDEDEQLLLSVAASAATALATARSVAAERLRLSLEAAEEARARWARELHDQTLQGLTGAHMVLSAGLAREDTVALRGAAETADARLASEMRGLRDLITELRPAALDDLGLGPAIESLARRQAAAAGFELELRIELAEVARPRETERAIYRIVQEAISNVVKHADARTVGVEVIERPGWVEIGVRDDGRGFSPDRAREGFGLTGMRERAMLLGGQLSLASSDGGPTRVSAVVPLGSRN
jgi:signal transduction histidine kinase